MAVGLHSSPGHWADIMVCPPAVYLVPGPLLHSFVDLCYLLALPMG